MANSAEAGGLTNTPMLEQVFVNPDHSSQVLYQLSELWRDKKLCDATIEVGPVKVYVHRLVLLAACPYLLTVGGQHEVSILEVKLPMTVGLEGLNVFLTYLYDGVLHLTSANLRSVEKLTKILKVTSIQKFCQEFRDSNKETGVADKLSTDYSLKMTNSSLQIIFSEIQSEMKRESIESEADTPSKRPRMNLDKLSAALQKKSGQPESVKDSERCHSVSSSVPSEVQHDDSSSDPLMMQVKEEPVSDYEDDDDGGYSEDTSESFGGTTDFVRQAPYDTRPFPKEPSATSSNKLPVTIPPPPSLQKRPSFKQKSFPPSAQTSETDVATETDMGPEGSGVDATKVLKNIVKSMPEMAMNLGTSSEMGDDNKPRMFLRLNEDNGTNQSTAPLSGQANQDIHDSFFDPEIKIPFKRFRSVSTEDIQLYEAPNQKDTTRKNTRWAVKILQEWHVENFHYQIDMSEVLPGELSEKLLKFYLEAKPKARQSAEKQDYHKNTFKNIRAGINRHLQDLGRTIDVVTDKEFHRANKCMEGMLKERIRTGSAQPTTHKETIDMFDLQKISRYFNHADKSPVVLRQCILYYISVHFLTKGVDFLSQLHLQSFQFHKDEDGPEFVSLAPEMMQTCAATGNEGLMDKRMYATNQPNCPVKMLKSLISRTNQMANTLFNKFSKDALHDSSRHSVWYSAKALSKRTFITFMPDICHGANCSKRYTPQCLRATVVQLINQTGLHMRQDVLNSGCKSEDKQGSGYQKYMCQVLAKFINGAVLPIPQPIQIQLSQSTGPAQIQLSQPTGPAQIQLSQPTGPAQIQLSQPTRPAQIQLSRPTRPAQIQLSHTQPAHIQLSQARPAQIQLSRAQPAQIQLFAIAAPSNPPIIKLEVDS